MPDAITVLQDKVVITHVAGSELLEPLVARATTAAQEAETAAATAESAAGPTYTSTGEGIAATTNGQGFAVDNGDDTVSVYLNVAGSAVLQRTLATSAHVEATYAPKVEPAFTGGGTFKDGRYALTNLPTFTGPVEATFHLRHDAISAAGAAIGANFEGYWQGTAAEPLENNDTILVQHHHRALESGLHRSWGQSMPAYIDIASDVEDEGEVLVLHAWNVAPSKAGWQLDGILGSQVAGSFVSGFRGTGRHANAKVRSSYAVRASLESEDGTIENGIVGSFSSVVGDGVVEWNAAIVANASGGNLDYSLYGLAGRMFNTERLALGNELTQTDAMLCIRRAGNCGEFGDADTAGFVNTFGATAGTGRGFLAFNAEAMPSGDTFKTRGKAGTVFMSDGAGGARIARLTNVSAEDQTPTDTVVFGANGDIFLNVHASFEGGTFIPVGDGARDMGLAGANRWRDLFIANAPTVSSDARGKVLRADGGPTPEERTWARAIRPACYKLKDSIAAKGDAARLHWGVLAQQVYQAGLDAGIEDPFAHGFLSRDAVTRKEMQPVKVERVKMETYQEPAPHDPRPKAEWLKDGALLDRHGKIVTKMVERSRCVMRMEPVLDEATGKPVMVRAPEAKSTRLLDAGGRKAVKAARMVPLTREVPVMETVEEMQEVRVPVLDADGKQEVQWGIRYEELIMFLLACGAAAAAE